MALTGRAIHEDPDLLQSELVTSAYWTPTTWTPMQKIEVGALGSLVNVGPSSVPVAIYGGSEALDQFPYLIEDAPAPQDPFRWLGADPRAESIQRDARVGAWVVEIADRFDQLMAMSPNWDGQGASPIEVEHVLAAIHFLTAVMDPDTPAPTIVPTAEGGVQLEWHCGGVDVELLLGSEEDDLYIYDLASEREWEGPAVAGFAEFDLARRLLG